MKYENLDTCAEICKKIDAHKKKLEALKDGPYLTIFNYAHNPAQVMELNPKDGEYAKETRELINSIISDLESRIELLKLELDQL